MTQLKNQFLRLFRYKKGIFLHNFLFIFLLLGLFGCSSNETSSRVENLKQWMNPNGKVKVFSTTAMIDDLVQQVGGEYVDTLVLIKGELDPHSYQLVKGDDEKLAFADIIFFNGLGLEHGASLSTYLNQQKKAIALGNKLQLDHPELILLYKGQLDPHIWMDVSLWSQTVPYIVQAISEKDPAHAEQYKTNGDHLIRRMLETHEHIKNELQSLPSNQRYLVTSHDAFNYFARAYLAEKGENESSWRLRFVAPEGLAPESQISLSDIQATISHLAQYQIHTIFPESNVNRDSIRKIAQAAKEKGLEVRIADVYLYADAMGSPGSEESTYLKTMEYNGHTIASQLKEQPVITTENNRDHK